MVKIQCTIVGLDLARVSHSSMGNQKWMETKHSLFCAKSLTHFITKSEGCTAFIMFLFEHFTTDRPMETLIRFVGWSGRAMSMGNI